MQNYSFGHNPEEASNIFTNFLIRVVTRLIMSTGCIWNLFRYSVYPQKYKKKICDLVQWPVDSYL